MEIVIAIIAAASLLLNGYCIREICKIKKGETVTEEDERSRKEFEKAWQDGIANILAYDLSTARKAGNDRLEK